MRIITVKRLIDASDTYPKAKSALAHWVALTKAAKWASLADTHATFRHADQIEVKSRKTVTIFNITNDFRLITAIHCNTGIVFILLFLTHAAYSKDNWKKTL